MVGVGAAVVKVEAAAVLVLVVDVAAGVRRSHPGHAHSDAKGNSRPPVDAVVAARWRCRCCGSCCWTSRCTAVCTAAAERSWSDGPVKLGGEGSAGAAGAVVAA